jgi:phospholipase D1/2
VGVVGRLAGARSQIFLTGPWVSPDLYLLRPPHKHAASRLDRLLELKAKEGVHVYVLLFKEPPDMTVNSKYSKGRFAALDHQGRIHVSGYSRGRAAEPRAGS